MKMILFVILALGGVLLPGCIVGEIRDELKGINENLLTVQESLEKLDQTNERILKTNESLTRTNTLINDVERGLLRLDSTNASLGEVDKRLMLLASIDSSMHKLDVHLASLRGTINKLDGVIPFLDLGGGDAPPEPGTEAAAEAAPAAETVAATPPAEEPKVAGADQEPAQAAPAESAPAAAAAKKAPEPLSGTWLIRHPKDGGLLVILPGNKYILVELTAESRGEWKREGNKIMLTQQFPEAFRRKEGAPPPKPDESKLQPKDNPNYERLSRTIEMEVITSSPRNATVRMDGALVVLARPS